MLVISHRRIKEYDALYRSCGADFLTQRALRNAHRVKQSYTLESFNEMSEAKPPWPVFSAWSAFYTEGALFLLLLLPKPNRLK